MFQAFDAPGGQNIEGRLDSIHVPGLYLNEQIDGEGGKHQKSGKQAFHRGPSGAAAVKEAQKPQNQGGYRTEIFVLLDAAVEEGVGLVEVAQGPEQGAALPQNPQFVSEKL